jgi:hypothetical protein
VFKKTFNKYVFDSPEAYAIGFLSIMYFATFVILNNIFLFDTFLYESKLRGIIAVLFLILVFIVQYMYYLKNDNYKKIEKKVGGNFFVGVLIMIVWIYAVYWYIDNHWKVG